MKGYLILYRVLNEMEGVMKSLLGNYYDETGMFLTVIAAGKVGKSDQSNVVTKSGPAEVRVALVTPSSVSFRTAGKKRLSGKCAL